MTGSRQQAGEAYAKLLLDYWGCTRRAVQKCNPDSEWAKQDRRQAGETRVLRTVLCGAVCPAGYPVSWRRCEAKAKWLIYEPSITWPATAIRSPVTCAESDSTRPDSTLICTSSCRKRKLWASRQLSLGTSAGTHREMWAVSWKLFAHLRQVVRGASLLKALKLH